MTEQKKNNKTHMVLQVFTDFFFGAKYILDLGIILCVDIKHIQYIRTEIHLYTQDTFITLYYLTYLSFSKKNKYVKCA